MRIDAVAPPVSPAEAAPGADRDAGAERTRLMLLAAEFEAMLLTQVLRDMRTSGSWKEEEDDGGTLGAGAFLETFDVELARHLASVQGFGLARELVGAWTRREGASISDAAQAVPAGLPADLQASAAAALAGVAAPAELAASGVARPDEDVTSAFGWRADPFDGIGRFHAGVDIRAAYGEDVVAAGPGRVSFSGDQGGYGVTVVVDHGNGVQTRYAHLSEALVKAGDALDAGQVLGRVGQTGRATGPHLHFEVTVGGRRIDPGSVALNPGGVVADLTRQSTAARQEQ